MNWLDQPPFLVKTVHRLFKSKISLRFLLPLFFVTQIVTIAGLVAYISFRNGQAAVNTVALELRESLSARIEQHLVTFLQVPHTINQSNANLIRAGSIHADDVGGLQAYFGEQLRLNPLVTSIYFGNEQGGIAGSGREGAEGIFYVYSTPDFRAGPFEKFALTADGKKGSLLAQVPNFDARTRVWYVNAIKKKSPVWNDIYVLITGQDMAISASAPVYDPEHNLIGVTSVDIFLSHMSNFLQSMDENDGGVSFIIERSGFLVATSNDEQLTREMNSDGKLERVEARLSETPLIQNAANALHTEFGDYENIQSKEKLQFEMDGERQFLQVSPLQDEYGIDWLIVVVSPESAFMSQIQQNNRWATTIIVLSVIISIAVSLWAVQKIIDPILELASFMDALKNKQWDGAAAKRTRLYEINQLSHAFNQMRETLQLTMQKLSGEVHERKQAEALMRASEDRYRTLVENIPMGVFRIGTTGKIIATNPSFLNMFKIKSVEELEQITARELFVTSRDAAPFMHDLVSKGKLTNVEIQFKKTDGSYFWGSVIVRAVLDSSGEIVHFDGTLQDVTEQKKAAETLHYLATHDSLTAIPNRAFFEERLSQATALAAQRNTGLAILFLDLDDFKAVNDTFGHLEGDSLLQLVAQRISSCLRVSDTVARFGGDEFAVFLDGLHRDVNIRPIIDKIMHALSQPFSLDGREVHVTASIGVSIYPDDGMDLDTLIQNADNAMYRSKLMGKNSWSFSSPPGEKH
jgi:diguanylate cyclase (GGDEF)-like protein/PAS domain S-box-containing protein